MKGITNNIGKRINSSASTIIAITAYAVAGE